MNSLDQTLPLTSSRDQGVSTSANLTERSRSVTPACRGEQLVICLDNSASMLEAADRGESASKLDMLKRSAIATFSARVRQQAGGTITLVVFSDKAKVAASVPADRSGHTTLLQSLNAMNGDASTNIVDALEVGGQAFDPDAFAPRRLVLLSDGKHNAGGDPVAVAERLKSRCIAVATIGFGPDADEGMLRSVASSQQGVPMYWHARDQRSLTYSIMSASNTLTL